ncbi:hypothetical protein APH_0789 [Anaplasma phagocytophilum str. HZ]|uniref:Uncharacterized protein n=1 Tax=Anaplasma phagocytophilum (strain HZ) TaxID=212042 RepID=Q2GJT5_ANAPZ|nr:hypothetical protein APH_0789 [Anaplasma phagocytophilum str. HZ]
MQCVNCSLLQISPISTSTKNQEEHILLDISR